MTKIESNEVERFSRLFQGYEGAHGIYEINQKDADGKLTGKARTVSRSATIEDYRSHLEGKTGIGIIPLLKDDKAWFGAIDLDIKGETKLREDHFILEAKLRALKLPLLLCRSKSNGAHLYLFASEPLSARLVQDRLNEFAALLGYGGCEIFPKQVTRIKETDYGNWINLSYFGDTRPAIHEGKERDLKEFLGFGQYLQVSNDELRAFKIDQSKDFLDGPPCLQQLCTLGFQEGNRNNALFNVGVYFKKKDDKNWQEPLRNFNQEKMDPPLPEEEVREMISSLMKKPYNYGCKQAPIVSYCNKKLCRTRPWGVLGHGEEGSEDTKLPIQSLTQYLAGDSVRYGVNTGEVMVEFSGEEFFSLEIHRQKYAQYLRICIPSVKQQVFHKQINDLLAKCEVVIDPEEASESGYLVVAFESWFQEQGSAPNAEDMIKGKWWQDPTNGLIYFQKEGLMRYLSRHKDVKKLEPHKTWRLLKNKFELEEDRIPCAGELKRVWKLSNYEIKKTKPLKKIKGIEKEEQV